MSLGKAGTYLLPSPSVDLLDHLTTGEDEGEEQRRRGFDEDDDLHSPPAKDEDNILFESTLSSFQRVLEGNPQQVCNHRW